MKFTVPFAAARPGVGLEPVAFDSLGVMGMCTRVTTPDVTVTIDPAASIEPDSFPLPRARREELLANRLEAVARACADSRALVISHYHLDHFIPARDPRLYSGKVIFAKSLENLPTRQADAARRFFRTIDGLPLEVIWADGRRFRFGRTEVGFSNPVWHGSTDASPGKVLMTEVERGRTKVLIASDIAGPTERRTAELIASLGARDIILDGYPTYGLGRFANECDLVRSIINVCRILAAAGLKTLCIDHHLARDPRYPAFFRLCYEKAAVLKKRFGTSAELAGCTSAVLEPGPAGRDSGPTLGLPECRSILRQAVATGNLESDWLSDLDRFVA
ncbi:hypothetical protein FJY71_00485 [candidate division WOR-3 bacterium]|nr:hypothetical protein [candidate division WOR-3 bacterium]